MLHARVIPCLLLKGGGLYKTVKFKNARYVGDPINAVRIFNEKDVDEVVFLDIGACHEGRGPNFELLEDIASEAFMPFGYGGGVTSMDQVQRLFKLGVEKIILNTALKDNPRLITSVAEQAGSSSAVASIDVRRNWRGKYTVAVTGATRNLSRSPAAFAHEMESSGAGEILLNAVDRDGTMCGYDIDLINQVSHAVSIPVVAVGGAGTISHFREALRAGASAVGAGSMFVFQGKHRAVLITYPEYTELEKSLK